MPKALRAICQKAMAKAADERFRNAHQLSEALEHFATDAFAQTSESSVSFAANVASVLAVLSLVLTYVGVSYYLPSISTLGPVGVLIVFFTIDSLLLSAVEDRTRGRFALWPLSLCFAFATFLFSLAATAGQVGRQMVVLEQSVVGSSSFNLAALEGVGMSVTIIINGMMLTALQVVVWGIVRRRVLLAAGR